MDKNLKKIIDYFMLRGGCLHRTEKHYIYNHPKGGTVTISRTASKRNYMKDVKNNFLREGRINNH